MRYGTIAALVMVPAVLTQARPNALPCDNTRWCAEYAPSAEAAPIAVSSPLSSAGQP